MSTPPKSTMRAPAARWTALRDVVCGKIAPGMDKKKRSSVVPLRPSVLLPERLRRDRTDRAGAPSVGPPRRRATHAPRDRSPDRCRVLAVLLPERYRDYAFGGAPRALPSRALSCFGRRRLTRRPGRRQGRYFF